MTTTHAYLLIDESGSMGLISEPANRAIREWLQAIQTASRNNNQRTLFNVAFFDDAFRWVARDVPMDTIAAYNTSIRPRGSTALRTAMVNVADVAKHKLDIYTDDSAIVLTVTDGQENCSLHTNSQLQAAIRLLLGTGRADVALLCPPGASRTAAMLTGLDQANIREWEQTVEGLRYTTESVTSSFNSYYQARSVGKQRVGSFFVDPDKLTSRDLSALTNISGQCVTIAVTNRDPVAIEPFWNKKLKTRGPYQKGKLFYELTKPEKIQAHKSIIVHDMDTGAMYSGADARHVLGIAATGEIRIRPGDDKRKRVFVQSTSNNRKLVIGTEVVFWERA